MPAHSTKRPRCWIAASVVFVVLGAAGCGDENPETTYADGNPTGDETNPPKLSVPAGENNSQGETAIGKAKPFEVPENATTDELIEFLRTPARHKFSAKRKMSFTPKRKRKRRLW
jgi:hypothetical protein